jgi:hypothetical protein
MSRSRRAATGLSALVAASVAISSAGMAWGATALASETTVAVSQDTTHRGSVVPSDCHWAYGHYTPAGYGYWRFVPGHWSCDYW